MTSCNVYCRQSSVVNMVLNECGARRRLGESRAVRVKRIPYPSSFYDAPCRLQVDPLSALANFFPPCGGTWALLRLAILSAALTLLVPLRAIVILLRFRLATLSSFHTSARLAFSRRASGTRSARQCEPRRTDGPC